MPLNFSLFRGATQKRNGLRAISYAADCCSHLRCINSMDDPIALNEDYKLMTVNCTVKIFAEYVKFQSKSVKIFIHSEKSAISSSLIL